jgi:hypothetical protein
MKMMKTCLIAFLCCQSVTGFAATNEQSRSEIDARHHARGTNGTTIYGVTYGDRETVAVSSIGTNRTSIAAKLGPPYPVSDRYVSEGGTYFDIHDTFEARWWVTYSHDDKPLKIERAAIVKDAEANKMSEGIRK